MKMMTEIDGRPEALHFHLLVGDKVACLVLRGPECREMPIAIEARQLLSQQINLFKRKITWVGKARQASALHGKRGINAAHCRIFL